MPRHTPPSQGQPMNVAVTVHILDSKLRLLAQRIKVIENNIQVIARTIVNHNKQLKELEGKVSGGGVNKEEIVQEVLQRVGSSGGSGIPPEQLAKIEEDISAIRDDLARVKAKVSQLEYIINSINTMNFVTMDQLKEALDNLKK